MNSLLLVLCGWAIVLIPVVEVYKKYGEVTTDAVQRWVASLSLAQVRAVAANGMLGTALVTYGWYSLLAVWR